jgi:hypothetical protein
MVSIEGFKQAFRKNSTNTKLHQERTEALKVAIADLEDKVAVLEAANNPKAKALRQTVDALKKEHAKVGNLATESDQNVKLVDLLEKTKKADDTATKELKKSPQGLKDLVAKNPKALDRMVEQVGDKVSSKEEKAFIKNALEARYDMKLSDDTEISKAAFVKFYKLFGMVPDSHTKDNPSLKSLKRDPASGEASFYKDKAIVLNLGRSDSDSTADFDYDGDDAPVECQVPPEHRVKEGDVKYFDHTTLHEIGHAVDDKLKFMSGKGKKSSYGGWHQESKNSMADVAGEHFGFYDACKDFPRPFLKSYLMEVLAGNDPTKAGNLPSIWKEQVGIAASLPGKNALLSDPGIVLAESSRVTFEQQNWEFDEKDGSHGQAFTNAKMAIKLKANERKLAIIVIELILLKHLKIADAVDAALEQAGTVTDTNSQPDWNKLTTTAAKAAAWCEAVRCQSKSSGLWEKGGSEAKKQSIAGRVYQQSYIDGDQWNSYELSARKAAVSAYQFRAPGEWFAELYAAYYLEKLPDKHPAMKWLQKIDQ